MKTLLRSCRFLYFGILVASTLTASRSLAQTSPELSVTITSPTNGSTFAPSTNINLMAVVTGTNDLAASVAFLDGSQLLGVVTNFVVVDPGGPPTFPHGGRGYLLTWTNPTVGPHSITALAIDTNRNGFLSPAVSIVVEAGSPVQFVSPAQGSQFPPLSNIPFDIAVADPQSNVVTVQLSAMPLFYGPIVPPRILATLTNFTALNPPDRDFQYTWTNVPAGTWTVTATALFSDTNNRAIRTALARTTFTVAPTVTNIFPPTIRITSPPNYAVFAAPADIVLDAYVTDFGAAISNVSFYAGSNFIGAGHPWSASPVSPIRLSFYYQMVWSNPAPATYSLTAVATSASGVMSTSPPISITVYSPPPPPTNLPTIVSVIASSPIAIDGTNCWITLGGPITWSNWFSTNAIWQWVTNCGPQDATFTVHRYGSTNNPLTLNYTLGGTATNGVDYAALPGSVTIPAGELDATITVVPINTNAAPIDSTVLLSLDQDTNKPPGYFLGIARAAALIIDAPTNNVPVAILPDRSFAMNLPGPDGAWFRIDSTSDLSVWTPVCTNQVVNGNIEFIDPNATNSTGRMYRAVPLPAMPSE